MHELAVAQEILALVQRHVPEAQAPQVRAVRVRIGALAGIVPDSLEFCFSAVVAGTAWEQAMLVMEHVAAAARCRSCNTEFPTEVPGAGCPACGSRVVRMVRGQELHVDCVDLDDGETATTETGMPAEARV